MGGQPTAPDRWIISVMTEMARAAEALAEVGAAMLTSHQEMPWGCRVVAEDPDGRAVEINQRGHCPGS
jgi:predicted enzyme related to lactoylglutathione lyase